MLFRLLIDLEVLDQLNELPPLRRRLVFDHLRKIQKFPGHYSDHISQNSEGQRLDVSVFGKWHIFYWIDTADRHIKILQIVENE